MAAAEEAMSTDDVKPQITPVPVTMERHGRRSTFCQQCRSDCYHACEPQGCDAEECCFLPCVLTPPCTRGVMCCVCSMWCSRWVTPNCWVPCCQFVPLYFGSMLVAGSCAKCCQMIGASESADYICCNMHVYSCDDHDEAAFFVHGQRWIC